MKMFKVTIPRTKKIPKGDSFVGVPEMLETLRRNIRKFLAYHPDQYVLVHGQEIVGYFNTYSEGINEGYQRFNLDPFLVQRAGEMIEPVRRPKTLHDLKSLFRDFLRGDLFIGFQPRHH